MLGFMIVTAVLATAAVLAVLLAGVGQAHRFAEVQAVDPLRGWYLRRSAGAAGVARAGGVAPAIGAAAVAGRPRGAAA